MTDIDRGTPISRRRVLAMGGGLAAGLLAPALAAATPAAGAATPAAGAATPAAAVPTAGRTARAAAVPRLPVAEMQKILQAEGTVSKGVLQVPVDRDDIQGVTLAGVPIKPAFQITGDLTFQPLAGGQAFFNGDIPLKAGEVNPVIAAILANNLVLQAEHQHFYDFDPPVWFIHFRGRGTPVRLARAVRAVLAATSTPLPQQKPSTGTPLQKARLMKILHGDSADVGNDGVVTVSVPRRDQIVIAGGPRPVGGQHLDHRGLPAPRRRRRHRVRGPRLRHGGAGDQRRGADDAGPGLGHRLSLQPGDRRAAPALLLPPVQGRGPYRLALEVRRGLNRTNSR